MTVTRMLSEMPSTELSEWYAFGSIEPIGSERSDFQAGIAPDFWEGNIEDATEQDETQGVDDMQARLMLAAGGMIDGNTGEPISQLDG